MKNFKETKLGKILTSKGLGDALDIAGSIGVPGASAVAKIIDKVQKSNELSPEDKQMIQEAAEQYLHELDAYYKDVADARSREIELVKAGAKNYTQNILAYIGVSSFFFIVGYLIVKGLGNMDSQSAYIVGTMTGLSGSIAKDIYGYYFGSSKGSQDKNTLLNLQKRPQ